MRITFIGKAAFLFVVLVVSTALSCAQTGKSSTQNLPRPDLAVGYSYVHSNAPVGGCGCFNLNGGSATFAWPVAAGRFALVGDITAVHAGGISSSKYSLTLSSYAAGVRYLLPFNIGPLQPFGQALVGVAHSSGSLVQGQNSPASNAAAAFAANVGGGLDLHASRRFSLRLVEADYLATGINNGSNNHQNNLRIRSGVVVHF
jgi:outer membrane immunogenic protein